MRLQLKYTILVFGLYGPPPQTLLHPCREEPSLLILTTDRQQTASCLTELDGGTVSV